MSHQFFSGGSFCWACPQAVRLSPLPYTFAECGKPFWVTITNKVSATQRYDLPCEIRINPAVLLRAVRGFEILCPRMRAVGIFNLPGWRWAAITKVALDRLSRSLHSDVCDSDGCCDAVVHSTISGRGNRRTRAVPNYAIITFFEEVFLPLLLHSFTIRWART